MDYMVNRLGSQTYKNMKAFYIIAGVGFIILMIQSYKLVSSNLKTENQKYRLVQKEAQYEIRFYPAATFAKIYSPGTNYKSVASSGFNKLAGYIFGGNDQNKSIAMTAPVRMEIGTCRNRRIRAYISSSRVPNMWQLFDLADMRMMK